MSAFTHRPCAVVNAILYLLFALWQPWGMVIGFLLAFFTSGDIALVGLSAVIAGVARFVLLFLVNTLLDIGNAMFTFYAIDKANATVSGEHGAKLHGTVGTFITSTGQTDPDKPVATQMGTLGGNSQQVANPAVQIMQQQPQGGYPPQQQPQGGYPPFNGVSPTGSGKTGF